MAETKPDPKRAKGAGTALCGGRHEEFWTGDQRRVAWLMTAAWSCSSCLQLIASYRINVWNREIFDALEKKDGAAVVHQAWLFIPLAVFSIAVAILVVWARMRIQRRWRAWMTEHVGDRWLNDGRYYQLNLVAGEHKNPEHRLTEDMRIATEAPVDLAAGILTAFLTSATFIGVLWFGRRRPDDRLERRQAQHPGLSGHFRGDLLHHHHVRHAVHRAQLRADRRTQEPVRGGIPLRADAAARERREHRHPRRREGGARRPRQAAVERGARLRQARRPVHAHDVRVARQLHRRIGDPDHPVRAEVSRRHHDARSGHAGDRGVHPGAVRLQLDRRQLSAARRIHRVGAPRRQSHGLARPSRPAPTSPPSSAARSPKARRSGSRTCRSS